MAIRPKSPYLSIYKPQIGSIFSILQRISGIFILLSFLFLGILYYLSLYNLTFFNYYSLVFYFFASTSTLILAWMYLLIISIFYHIFFSVRYLYWTNTGGMGTKMAINLESLNITIVYFVIGFLILISLSFYLFI